MLIQSKKVWIADQFIAAAIEITDGKITDILPYGSRPADVDYGDLRIVPGFLDIHCHGAFGFDTNDANEEGLRNWTKNIVTEGVTGFLATTITQSEKVLTDAVANVAKVMDEGYEGAEILGIHFEGPYLDMVYKGAQPEQYIVKPTIEQFKHYQEAAKGHIKYITMATETDDDFALTRYLTENGVVVSIGHSAATYEQAVMAYAHGARSMTHVYSIPSFQFCPGRAVLRSSISCRSASGRRGRNHDGAAGLGGFLHRLRFHIHHYLPEELGVVFLFGSELNADDPHIRLSDGILRSIGKGMDADLSRFNLV